MYWGVLPAVFSLLESLVWVGVGGSLLLVLSFFSFKAKHYNTELQNKSPFFSKETGIVLLFFLCTKPGLSFCTGGIATISLSQRGGRTKLAGAGMRE